MFAQQELQARYDKHRTTRNIQQKQKILDPNFNGVVLDQILRQIEDPTIEPGYCDPRHCLVFWARPPQKVKNLIDSIQQKLRAVAPRKFLFSVYNEFS